MKYIFINHDALSRVGKNTHRILKANPDSFIQDWQLMEMVATIESGLAYRTVYHKDSIVVGGWNGYIEKDGSVLLLGQNNESVDPYGAWGGFYRTENMKQLGRTISLLLKDREEGKEIEDGRQLGIFKGKDNKNYVVIFEAAEKIWGYVAWKDCYTENEAQDILDAQSKKSGFKRGAVEYGEMSGCYRVRIESSRKPREDFWHSVYRKRIEQV